MFVLQSSEHMSRSQRQPSVPFLVKLDVEGPHLVVGIDNLHCFFIKLFLFLTPGMVVACLVKEIQICTELRKMAEMGLIQSEVVRPHYY